MAAETVIRHPTKIKDLGEALRVFATYPTPWILLVTTLIAWATRLMLGGFGWVDLVVTAGILAFWPIQEWLIHVFILHFKPIHLGKQTLDLHVAQKHRAHHGDPNDMTLTFIPLRTLLQVILIGLPVFLFVWTLYFPLHIGMTGVAVFATFGLVYEWVHYLVHTSYRAKTRWYKALWQHHKWHHFKNENYWFGVSRLEGDALLKTAPDPGSVESSPTCRNLHGVEQ